MFLFEEKEGGNIFLKEKMYKDITKLYDLIDVVGSDIITSKGRVNIYKIKPCTLIGENEEFKENIYNAYKVVLKMLRFDYQIIITTGKIKFKGILDVLDKNIYASDNIAQKQIIKQYKEYLHELSKEIQIFTKTFYLATNKLNMQEENQLIEAFNQVRHLGITIIKIVDENKIYNILYESINKVGGGMGENEY